MSTSRSRSADSTWVNMGPADDALRKLTTQTSVRTLQIGGEQVTDENLSYVGQMTGLEELSISWGFHLTDKGFVQLSGLKRLRILEVDHSKMTDASLEAIGKLTKLEELRIGGEGFSDRGLAQLKGLTRLKYLSLGEGNKPDLRRRSRVLEGHDGIGVPRPGRLARQRRGNREASRAEEPQVTFTSASPMTKGIGGSDCKSCCQGCHRIICEETDSTAFRDPNAIAMVDHADATP